jgi:hypothetical protein
MADLSFTSKSFDLSGTENTFRASLIKLGSKLKGHRNETARTARIVEAKENILLKTQKIGGRLKQVKIDRAILESKLQGILEYSQPRTARLQRRNRKVSPLTFSRSPILNLTRQVSTPSFAKTCSPSSTLKAVINECSQIERRSSQMHSQLTRLKTRMKRRFDAVNEGPAKFKRSYISHSVKQFRREKKAFIYGPDLKGEYLL